MARQFITRATAWARLHRRIIYVATGIAVVVSYAFLFVIPKNIQFTYAQTSSCMHWPTILPALNGDTESDDAFRVSMDNNITIAGVPVMATTICIEPIEPPKPGSSVVSIAPFGWWKVFHQNIRVIVPDAPDVSAGVFANPIATTKPITIRLDQIDRVHTYSLHVNEKKVKCISSSGEASIDCDLPSLKLEQGETYEAEIWRTFKASPPKIAMRASLITLTETAVIASSVSAGETIYNKPTEFTLTTDKSLASAKVSIVQDGAPEQIAAVTSVKDATITATLAGDLPRDKGYTLSLSDLEATDGSSLTEPYTVAFRTSGGPKVTGVSIDRSGVNAAATIAVTFDQELSTDQDISKYATITGGTAQISKNGRQVLYSLRGMGLCTPFTLSIAKGIESKYAIASTDTWSYASRTVCHTTSVYGYSVGGRALVAYTFGTGGPVIMYVGAIHGNEPSSKGLLNAWIDDLEANPSLYRGQRVVVVPSINPDGIVAGTRTNARGVNLNRNFPTDGWTADINDTDGPHSGGGGATPLSEPEASALAILTTSLRPQLLLSFHAVGSLVVGDYGGYSAPYASRYASRVGYRDATGQSGTFDYDITGAYEDWSYSKQGIPSMVVELGSYGYFNFPHHRAALRAMLD